MQFLWNKLMRTDARSLFLICLLALFAMLGWRGYVEYSVWRGDQEVREARPEPTPLPSFPEYEGFGILEYIAEQTKPDARALPVDLFRPTFDAMVSNLVNEILNNPDFQVETPPPPPPRREEPDSRPRLAPGDENLFELVQRPDGRWVKRSRQPEPAPELTYNGVFKRTDGRIAALIAEKNSSTTKFYGEGDDLFGGKLKEVDVGTITISMPDGEEKVLARGDTLQFPQNAPVEEEVFVNPGRAANDRGGRRGGGRRGGQQQQPQQDPNLLRRGRPQRMPTEEELKIIERANPEMAKQIRDAIQERQARERQQNDQQGARL